jgi:hypothetical protein
VAGLEDPAGGLFYRAHQVGSTPTLYFTHTKDTHTWHDSAPTPSAA